MFFLLDPVRVLMVFLPRSFFLNFLSLLLFFVPPYCDKLSFFGVF